MNRKLLIITIAIAVILILAFVAVTFIAIITAINVSVAVSDENAVMHVWISELEDMGWDIEHSPPRHGLAITRSESLPTYVSGWGTFSHWISELQLRNATTIYYRYAQVVFPFRIQHGFLYFDRAPPMSAVMIRP